MAARMKNAVEAKGLTKYYGSTKALDELDLQIHEGEVFGLLGPNGAGKTTTVRILITLLAPTAGEATVWGYSILNQPEQVRQIIGYIPQERALDKYLTGREHLSLMGDLYHLPKHETAWRAKEVLDLVDLQEKADSVVRNYSGGMKKKLEIACGLLHNPKVLFLDEPTLGLDVESRRKIWDHIRQLKEKGMTILMSTNYLDEADQLCDRIAIFDRGKIKALGPPQELKKGLGGDVVSIRLSGVTHPQLEAAARSLKGLEVAKEVTLRDNTLAIRVVSNETALSPLIQKINGLGYSVETIHYSRPSLEEVFITYTGHRIKEEE